MKISAGWQIILYAFAIALLIQGLDLPYYLMNQKDSYLANLGLVVLVALAAGVLYCFFQITINSVKFIKEVEEKEKQI